MTDLIHEHKLMQEIKPGPDFELVLEEKRPSTRRLHEVLSDINEIACTLQYIQCREIQELLCEVEEIHIRDINAILKCQEAQYLREKRGY